MAETVSSREANQQFAKLLRDVEAGKEFVITRNGVPVARLSPAMRSGERVLTPDQERAHRRMMELLERGMDLGGEKFDREALYAERLDRIGRHR